MVDKRPARGVSLSEPLANLDDFTAVLTQHVESSTLTANEKGTLGHQTQAPSQRRALTRLSGEGDSEIVLRELLSRGGQGAVYLAEQTSLQRLVAVKVATGKDGSTDERRAASLLVEARVSGRLEHPNIVPVHIVGTGDDGQPLLVMKRVEGQTWRKLINAGRDLERDVRILLDVCKALALAHSHGIAHCDVKPGNVMVGVAGDVYLVDWGVAVGFGDNAPADIPVAKDIKTVFGTPKYLAPEMALPQGSIDQRTDIYVCGAVLHELVTGTALHQGTVTEALLHAAHTRIGRTEPLFKGRPRSTPCETALLFRLTVR